MNNGHWGAWKKGLEAGRRLRAEAHENPYSKNPYSLHVNSRAFYNFWEDGRKTGAAGCCCENPCYQWDYLGEANWSHSRDCRAHSTWGHHA